MQLNEKQQLAINMASDWYAKQNAPVFKMAGYAGTGKTTVATTIARTLEADDNILLGNLEVDDVVKVLEDISRLADFYELRHQSFVDHDGNVVFVD